MAAHSSSSSTKTSGARRSSSTARKKSPSSSAQTRKPGAPRGSATQAVRLLTADHREVKALFQQYEELLDHDVDDDERESLAREICMLLTVHAQVEEEIFYPAAREAIGEPRLVDEAAVEHASAKELIAQIEEADPGDPLFDAKVTVLGEYIDHHVKEEEGELFPRVRRSGIDLEEIGRQLAARKSELMEEMGLADGASDGRDGAGDTGAKRGSDDGDEDDDA